MHAVSHPIRPGKGAGIEERHATFGHDSPINDCPLDVELLEILKKHQVSALARRDAAKLGLHLAALMVTIWTASTGSMPSSTAKRRT